MSIYTTISMDQSRLSRLEKIMEDYNISFNDLVKTCLKKIAPLVRKSGFNTGPLVYQPVNLTYEPVYFSMSYVEYEIYMDLKKVSKCTLSLLIAIAVDLYSDKIAYSNDIDDESNTYRKSNYIARYFIDKKLPVYMFSWGERVEKEEGWYNKIE
jgi:hypothetical protein